MTFNRNPDRAIRGPAARLALVKTVFEAPAETQEADWVEWKSEADLTEARWKFALGKHVLGLRNRMPERAARAAEGCGYILFGVEPQKLTGVTVHDAADVESWVRAYVGADGPEWDLDYIELNGKHVLVVTVDPPRQGDPIFALRRGFEGFQPGTIFVRRLGKTEQANPEDVAALSQRLSTADHAALEITLSLVHPDHVRPISEDRDEIDTWIQRERDRFLQRLSEVENRRALAMQVVFSEDRTPAQFRAEVDAYLDAMREEARQRIDLAAVRTYEYRATFAVNNQTEHNFQSLEVELFIPGARAYFDDDDVSIHGTVTSPPNHWGTGRIMAPFGRTDGLRVPRMTGGSVLNIDPSTEIRFPPLHLRPRGAEVLEEIHLLVDSRHAGTSLTGRWTATSTNMSGVANGEVEIPVLDAGISLMDLMPVED